MNQWLKTSIWKLCGFIAFVAVTLLKIRWFDKLAGVASPDILWKTNIVYLHLGVIAILSCWLWLLPRRGFFTALVALNFFVSFLFTADIVYYRYFKDFITIPVLYQFTQVSSLGGSITTLINWRDFLLYVDLPFWLTVAMILWLRRRRLGNALSSRASGPAWQRISLRMAGRIALAAIALYVGVSLYNTPMKKLIASGAGLFEQNWSNISVYHATGIMGFHGRDTQEFLDENVFKTNKIAPDELNEVKQWFADNSERHKQHSPMFGKYKGSNVIVIQAEAFQSFMIGQSIGGQEITPNLNKLIKENVYFTDFYHQTSQGRTSDADLLVNCSLYPLPVGSVYTRYSANTFTCMPSALKEQGYATAAFHPYDPSFWNRYNVYQNIGFDRFYSKKDFIMNEKVGWTVGDTSMFMQSVDKLKQTQSPFYAFITTLSSHHPFDAPAEIKKLNVGSFEGDIFGNYLHLVHYVDESVGKLVDRLKQEGLWDKTIVVFYGDHDDSINTVDNLSQLLGRQISELELDKIINQVPLIMHLPDGYTYSDTRPAGQIDVAPTVLDLLGIPFDSKYMMGDSLFKDDRVPVALRHLSFSNEQLTYYAKDWDFSKGTCTATATGDQLPLDSCKQGYLDTNNVLKISDRVVKFNLLKQFVAESKKAKKQ